MTRVSGVSLKYSLVRVKSVKRWKVKHIMDNKATEHPFTKPARVINGILRYDEPHLFD